MMPYIFALAFILGVITSVPIGAAGQLMIHRFARSGLRTALPIGLFSALLDAAYCGLALAGMSLVIDSVPLRSFMQGGGLIVLLYSGYKNIRPDKEPLKTENEGDLQAGQKNRHKRTAHLKYFSTVLMITVSNPTLPAFWLNMANVLRTSVLADAEIWVIALFSAGVGLGSAFCQYAVLRIIQHTGALNTAPRRAALQRISASVFILTLGFFAYYFLRGLV